MQSGTRIDCEVVDRLSSLSDDLIYKILSYVDIIYAIRLSVLSSRWRFIPTSMPNLNFASYEVYSISSRYKFVNDVLSARNNKKDVSAVTIQLSLENPELSVGRILEYAFSHNVQQLSISFGNLKIPPTRLSSKSLKHLTIICTSIDCRSCSTSWDLPALTALHLHHVKLHSLSSILAVCKNLENLTLERCEVSEHENSGFTIINSRLLSLTLKKVEWNVGFVHVDTPQLKNFIFVDTHHDRTSISKLSGELIISACDLTYLRIKGSYFPKISLDGFCSLEKVDLCISSPQKTDVHKICDLFQCLRNVKSLALSLEIVELLSTLEEAISHQPSPFTSLKSLKIYPVEGVKPFALVCLRTYQLKSSLEMFQTQLDEEQEAMKLKLSSGVTNYLLNSSSNTTFTMVSYEEARAIKITIVAYRLMAALWWILEETEAYTETISDNVESKKTLADGCLEDFELVISPSGDSKEIFCMLQNIKLLLTKVLASKRVEMQACFSRLSAKSETVVNKMVVDMKNQCDIIQGIFSGYLNELALSS